MRTGVNAGFGAPIGRAHLRQMADLGMTTVRVGPEGAVLDPEMVREHVDTPTVQPLFLVKDLAVLTALVPLALETLGQRWAVEFYNEPNLMPGMTPARFVEDVRRGVQMARDLGFTGEIITGGVSNLNADGFAFLYSTVLPKLPLDVTVGFHRYPPSDQNQTTAYAPYRTRDEELQTVVALAAPRRIACTEFGYHTADRRLWWFWHTHTTDAQVAANVTADLALFAPVCTQAVVYQWGDGAGTDALSRFGVTRLDGRLKPVASVFNAYRGPAATEESEMNTATSSVKRSQFLPQPNGLVAVKVGDNAALSIQPDGSFQTRTLDKIGAWESGADKGNKWVVSDPAYPTGSYSVLIAE